MKERKKLLFSPKFRGYLSQKKKKMETKQFKIFSKFFLSKWCSWSSSDWKYNFNFMWNCFIENWKIKSNEWRKIQKSNFRRQDMPCRCYCTTRWIRWEILFFYVWIILITNFLDLPGKIELIHAIVNFLTEENSADIEHIRKAMSIQVRLLHPWNFQFVKAAITECFRFSRRRNVAVCTKKDTILCWNYSRYLQLFHPLVII